MAALLVRAGAVRCAAGPKEGGRAEGGGTTGRVYGRDPVVGLRGQLVYTALAALLRLDTAALAITEITP